MKNIWENPDWCKKMQIQLDYNNIMAINIGDQFGICEDEISLFEKNVNRIINNLKNNMHGFMNLPFDEDVISEIDTLTRKVKNKFKNIIVLGIGGSALGGNSLISALKPSFYNLNPPTKKNPRIFFNDNIDPDNISELLNICNLKDTLFVVITKSGSTVETMSTFMFFKEKLKKISGKNHTKNIIVITDKENGVLRNIVKKEKIDSLVLPSDVGGRFSVLSSVGLLPAKLAGIDVELLLAGARYMHKISLNSSVWKNPAAINAIIHFIGFTYKKMNMVVMMPYSSKLKDIADWFRQLWAESLGKKYLKDNKTIVNTGSTPVKALGVTDQHSQLQLYMEGPYDKIINFIHVEKFNTQIKIPKITNKELKYLSGHTINELMEAEWASTEYALMSEKRPNVTIHIPEINPFTIGQLFYLFEMQTAIIGELLKIDTYNQPGVELSKNYTYGIFNRDGYEEKRKTFLNKPKKQKKYIV